MSYVQRVANGLKISSSSCHEKISLRDPHGRVLSLFRGFFRSNSSPVALLHSHSWSLRHFYGFGNQTYYKIRDRQLASICWVAAPHLATKMCRNRFQLYNASIIGSCPQDLKYFELDHKNKQFWLYTSEHHFIEHQTNLNINFRTLNELKQIHLLVIELEHPIFGFEQSNFEHCSTHHYKL